MINPRFIAKLEEISGRENVRVDEPMCAHTTFKVGGPADALVTPPDCKALEGVLAACADAGALYVFQVHPSGAHGIFGGTALRNGPTYGSASNPYHYSLIVESGFYNNIYFSESFYGAGTMYLYGLCTLGNDLDRVDGNNDNLDVYYSFQGNAGSSLRMRGP